ncbi:UNVERIFIED_CONTAM: hypothetical protein Sindi_0458400 [Sesamum indicum]
MGAELSDEVKNPTKNRQFLLDAHSPPGDNAVDGGEGVIHYQLDDFEAGLAQKRGVVLIPGWLEQPILWA